MNYKLRKICGFVASMSIAALCSASVMGCSESGTDTAGVLSETESGQTASLTVAVSVPVDVDYVMARAYLLKVEDGHTTVIDSASINNSNNVTFSKVPYNSEFSIVANALNEAGDVNLSGIITRKAVESECGLNDEGFAKDSISLSMHAPAILQVSTGIAEFASGDSICITGTTSCGVYDDEAKKSGFVLIQGIPAATVSGENSSTEAYANYSQIEIISGTNVRTDSVNWHVTPGDSAIAAKDAVVEPIAKVSFSTPTISSLDSLGDKSLDSLLVPFKREKKHSDNIVSSAMTNVFMDSQWNVLPHYFTKDADSATYWISLPSLKDSTEVQYTYGAVAPDAYENESRIRLAEGPVAAGRVIDQPLFVDSSFAFSFWFLADTADADRDSIILSAIEDGIGFELRHCGNKATEACLKIYNGIDTAATDTVEYGKVKLFDGKVHHYSLAIHKKHLSIIVDGKVLRSTDLKLSKNFYKLERLNLNADIESILLYSFGDFIRKPEDKGWHRLNAWLQAFYELQK